MNDPQLFERNMLAIASWHGPLAADRIREADADGCIGIVPARDGQPVPYIETGGRKSLMHSRFEPVREAERQVLQYDRTGFYVFLGMGAGYEITAFLNAGRVARGLIIEYRASTLKSILEQLDLTHILGDRRLHLLVDPTDTELAEAVARYYAPAVTGDFVSVPLRGRIECAQVAYQKAADLIRNAINAISDDYSVQSFFGKRWFSNIVRNLELSNRPTPPVGPIREAYVSAAGPSLETYLDEIADRPGTTFLIATDTSLRALLERHILPDAVISIDCQHISYYHFSLGLPERIPLFLDLASPPTVSRLASLPYFFSSGHPLCRYIASRFRAFPVLDTSGGNVTHAAVSLAEYLGASRIKIYGADFSYPYGKSYARGTYIYPYFDIRQSRLKPQESLFSDFLYRNQSIDRVEDEDGSFRYVTKPLVAYRERLERLSSGMDCVLERVRGAGVPAVMARPQAAQRQPRGRVFAAGRAFQRPDVFLASYARDIAALPEPYGQAAAYLDRLDAHEKDVWTTMLPAAAAFRREAGDRPPEPSRLLAITRDWCSGVVQDELERAALLR